MGWRTGRACSPRSTPTSFTDRHAAGALVSDHWLPSTLNSLVADPAAVRLAGLPGVNTLGNAVAQATNRMLRRRVRRYWSYETTGRLDCNLKQQFEMAACPRNQP